MQHCNAEIDDFMHGTCITSQSCTHTESSNFLGYVCSKFHNNMYKTMRISAIKKNGRYQPCNIKLSISNFLVAIIWATHILDNLSQMCSTYNNLEQQQIYEPSPMMNSNNCHLVFVLHTSVDNSTDLPATVILKRNTLNLFWNLLT